MGILDSNLRASVREIARFRGLLQDFLHFARLSFIVLAFYPFAGL